jgi:hypothetical protein
VLRCAAGVCCCVQQRSTFLPFHAACLISLAAYLTPPRAVAHHHLRFTSSPRRLCSRQQVIHVCSDRHVQAVLYVPTPRARAHTHTRGTPLRIPRLRVVLNGSCVHAARDALSRDRPMAIATNIFHRTPLRCGTVTFVADRWRSQLTFSIAHHCAAAQ